MVGVAMTDENVTHLVRRPEWHAPGIAQIKQKTAGLMQKPELQQRVTANTVHEGRDYGPCTHCHLRIAGNAGQGAQLDADLDSTIALLLAAHGVSRLMNYSVSGICAKLE
ncbi:hypothetical protein MS5N3_08240 [Marinobacter salsuginis]|uniref:Uncharacterized protein n=1 Tax=Marinobacter salsuginis TaxID=418719 RepID=A0A5M3PKD4_9GAMM|nr:hypothetical protein MS5N3_08240 [Marinobacter salsuginis]